MSSWCDKLGSTATVGVRLDWRIVPTETILSAVSPALDKMREGDRVSFNIERQGAFDLTINSNDGVNLSFDQSKFSTTFRHTLQLQNNSGAPPSARMISTPQPFSQLIDSLHSRLSELVPHVPYSSKRSVDRIGIVSTTSVEQESLPPGVSRFIKYLSRPFNGNLDFYNLSMNVAIETRSDFKDRCTISVTRVEGQIDDLVTINLDWQRTLTKSKALTVANLGSMYHDARISALDYFERIGEGGMFDEELIRTAEKRAAD